MRHLAERPRGPLSGQAHSHHAFDATVSPIDYPRVLLSLFVLMWCGPVPLATIPGGAAGGPLAGSWPGTAGSAPMAPTGEVSLAHPAQ